MSISKILCSMALAASVAFSLSPAVGRGEADGKPRCGRIGQAPRTATEHELRTSVLCLVNLTRERHGIPPLEFNAALRQSATIHSVSMVRSGAFSHYGPGGSTMMSRIAHAGYPARAAAENIGGGAGRKYGSPIAVVRVWMHSAGHRENILDRGLRDFGVGVAHGDPLGNGDDAATYTLDFGARRGN